MQKIAYPEFVDFFQSKIVPEVQFYEKYRIKTLKKIELLKITWSILVVPIYIYALIMSIKGSEGLWQFLEGIICFTIPFVIIVFFQLKMLTVCHKYSYRKKIKNVFYKKIFNLLDLNYINREDVKTNIKKLISKVYQEGILYAFGFHFTVDDVISGEYNGLPFLISDILPAEAKASRPMHISGKGLFMSIKTDKPYKGETIIITKDMGQPQERFSTQLLKTVKLEDVKFEQYFTVYGSDQIESRYILTPAFMRRLLDYRKQKKCDIEVIFSNKIGLDKNLFFFIYTGKNHFELPVEISLLNQDLLYGLVKEITSILDIVDALKLDQNIGL